MRGVVERNEWCEQGEARWRMRESSPGARIRCGAGGLNWLAGSADTWLEGTALEELAAKPWIDGYEARTRKMNTYTATTVPTQFVEANGIRFAYRRWGKRSGLPL